MTSDSSQTIKKRILDAASHLFVRGGYNGLSMREIAEMVGISKPALYYHYKDKDDLILAMLIDCLEEYIGLLDHGLKTSTSTYESLEGIVQSIFALPDEKRALIYMAEQEVVHLSTQSRDQFNRLYQEKFINKIKRIFEEGMVCGELRQMDVALVTHLFLGMVFPFFRHPIGNVKNLSDITLSIFFNGVAQQHV